MIISKAYKSKQILTVPMEVFLIKYSNLFDSYTGETGGLYFFKTVVPSVCQLIYPKMVYQIFYPKWFSTFFFVLVYGNDLKLTM